VKSFTGSRRNPMQDRPVEIKKRAAYSLQRGPEGNGHRRWVEGVSPVGPVTGDGVRCVAGAQPTTKGPGRVHLVTKLGLYPLFTAWNLAFRQNHPSCRQADRRPACTAALQPCSSHNKPVVTSQIGGISRRMRVRRPQISTVKHLRCAPSGKNPRLRLKRPLQASKRAPLRILRDDFGDRFRPEDRAGLVDLTWRWWQEINQVSSKLLSKDSRGMDHRAGKWRA
jgi:hypothetical protein